MAQLEYFIDHIKVTGPYLNKKQGRKFVTLTNSFTNKKTQKTYAKYLIEMSLGRELSSDETVDHIDRNKLNDVLNNLQILTRSDHISKDSKRAKLVYFNCPICNKVFERTAKSTRDHNKLNNAGPFCSASCRGKYGKQVQETGKKLPIQQYIESEYYYK